MTASDPRVGEIQACESHHWVSTNVPGLLARWVIQCSLCGAYNVQGMNAYLLAELRDRDEKLARVTNVLDGWAAEVPFEDAEDSQRWYSVGKRHAAERIRFEMAGRAAVAAANGGGE